MHTYHCVLHHTVAVVDPTSRTVRMHWPALSVGSPVGQCALSMVVYRAVDDPDAPCGVQGVPHPGQRGGRCEVIRDE